MIIETIINDAPLKIVIEETKTVTLRVEDDVLTLETHKTERVEVIEKILED